MLLSVYAFITTCLNQYILLVLGLELCTREWCTPLHRNYPKYVATYYYREQTFDLFHILYQGQHWSVQQKKLGCCPSPWPMPSGEPLPPARFPGYFYHPHRHRPPEGALIATGHWSLTLFLFPKVSIGGFYNSRGFCGETKIIVLLIP